MGALDGIGSAIAARQHGVIARWQLLAAGASRRWIAKRLGKGSLIRVYAGVYRVGHEAPSTDADYMAAVLACGGGAVLGGRAAAFLLGLLRANRAPDPDVLASTKRRIAGNRSPAHAKDRSPRRHDLEGHPSHNSRPDSRRLGRGCFA
jgi:hypothetical protein